MANNMDVLEKHLQRKIEEKIKAPTLLRHSKWIFSGLPQKKSWCLFALIYVLVWLMKNWERK